MTSGDPSLYALAVIVCAARFKDDLSQDEKIENVLPYVTEWVRRRTAGHPVSPELFSRMIA
jgi:hypothetical protein